MKLLLTFVLAVILTTASIAGIINVPFQYSTIQAGVNAAGAGDTVLVAAGTYTGSGNKNIELPQQPIVVISGSGPEDCIIDCENQGRGFYIPYGEPNTVIIDGFTIYRGYPSNPATPPYHHLGGGILCYNSSPTIRNCIIDSCRTGD